MMNAMRRRIHVAALIRDDAGRLLLCRQQTDSNLSDWDLPNELLLDNELPHETVLRAVGKFVGCPAAIDAYVGANGYYDDGGQAGIWLFFAVTIENDGIDVTRSAETVRWCPLDKVPREIRISVDGRLRLARGQSEEVAQVPVALIQPFFPFADLEAISIPLGLASLQACLTNNGVGAVAFDGSIPTDYVSMIRMIPRLPLSVVGIQFHSDMASSWAARTARWIRRAQPKSVIVAGGEVASAQFHRLLTERIADVVVIGEGEQSFVEVVQVLANRQDLRSVRGLAYYDGATGGVLVTDQREAIQDLDSLPLPALDSFRWTEYGQWSVFTSRGCPFRCTFCSSAAFWHHTVRCHSAERVVLEMRRLRDQYDAADVYIADDIFTVNKQRVRDICDRLIRANLGVRWSCLTRVDCVDADLLKLMKAAGCVLISYGIESGSEGSLERINKSTTPDRGERAIVDTHEAGIRVRVSIIFGIPSDRPDDLIATLEMLLRTTPDEIQLYGLTPHEGTVLFRDLTGLGYRILDDNPEMWSRDVMNPICDTELLPRETIRELAQLYVNKLQAAGYTYIQSGATRKKIGALRTVATAFSPVQVIRGVEPSSMRGGFS